MNDAQRKALQVLDAFQKLEALTDRMVGDVIGTSDRRTIAEFVDRLASELYAHTHGRQRIWRAAEVYYLAVAHDHELVTRRGVSISIATATVFWRGRYQALPSEAWARLLAVLVKNEAVSMETLRAVSQLEEEAILNGIVELNDVVENVTRRAFSVVGDRRGFRLARN